MRIHPRTELAERGVGVDGHHTVVLAQLGENGADTGGDSGLADAALTEHADLVLAAQQRANPGLQVCLLQFVRGFAEVDQPARGVVEQPTPTSTWRNLAARHQLAGSDALDVVPADRRRRNRCVAPARAGWLLTARARTGWLLRRCHLWPLWRRLIGAGSAEHPGVVAVTPALGAGGAGRSHGGRTG